MADPYGPMPGWARPEQPRGLFAEQARRLVQARRLLFPLAWSWAVTVLIGLLTVGGQAAYQSDGTELLANMQSFIEIALQLALWVVLGLWTSGVARACRAAARPDLAGRSSWVWWGQFVPVAHCALPWLGYAEAARASGADPQLIARFRSSWVLFVLTFYVHTGTFVVWIAQGFPEETSDGARLLAGGTLVASGVCGIAAVVVGNRALPELIRVSLGRSAISTPADG